jgi:tetratricopeptide (TPR) repeat protein
MGRTHLLCATFALASLGLHACSLEPRRGLLFVPTVAALVAAMLCKVTPGWVLLVVALEVCALGWRRMLAAPRVYIVAAICLVFAVAAYWTSQRAGLVEDAAAGLFGDPLARSALALWLYARNLLVPLWLSPWYLPDPGTNWGNPIVWGGGLIAVATIAHAAWAARRPERRLITIGWAWFWALLLPFIGLVGAREVAADDRYLYQPFMGLLLVAGVTIVRLVSRWSAREATAPTRLILAAGALLGAGLHLWTLPYVQVERSTLQSRTRIARLNPGDPRALEALARGYDFASNHAVPRDDLAEVPAGRPPYVYFLSQAVRTLREAATAPNLERYFPGPADRASFHRRLAYAFKLARQYQASLEQAETARQLQPEAFLTWVRLAHAYQGLGRWDEAVHAYERCEELLPNLPKTRAVHFTDFGYLWLFQLGRADLALPKFQAATATGAAPTLASIGLALCEIRAGEGARGAAMIRDVLAAEPQNMLAGLVLAEYHLRSHHWPQAFSTYGSLIAAYPAMYANYEWYYEALRGFHEVCAQTGDWHDAVVAWDAAVRVHPESRAFRSFRVWALACVGDDQTPSWADELLASDPDNPMACLAHALCGVRAGRIAEAVEWVRRARQGAPVPSAREFERAVNMLRLLKDLPPEARIVRAAIELTGGRPEAARSELTVYVDGTPDSAWAGLVADLLRECGPSATSENAPGEGR